jgi:hypothetical protein
MKRKISFETACARYVHRFTMDHVPSWARSFCTFNGQRKYYAPQFASDREWYEHTLFKGEPGHIGIAGDCYTSGQTWPLGQWLAAPFQKEGRRNAAGSLKIGGGTK